MSSLELQKAIVAALKADAGVAATVAGRVYDVPPKGVLFPYISIGPDQTLPQRGDCYDGEEVSFQVDLWSREVGFPEVKRIGKAVKAALNSAELTVDDHRLVDLYLEDARTFRDPDGLTSHAVLTFRALTEPV